MGNRLGWTTGLICAAVHVFLKTYFIKLKNTASCTASNMNLIPFWWTDTGKTTMKLNLFMKEVATALFLVWCLHFSGAQICMQWETALLTPMSLVPLHFRNLIVISVFMKDKGLATILCITVPFVGLFYNYLWNYPAFHSMCDNNLNWCIT